MYEEEFQRIIKASQNHSLSFFVGAGVSSLSGAPSWKKLIQQICIQIKQPSKDEYSSDENLRIPQIFYHSINEDKEQYYKFIEDNLIHEELCPNEVHKALLSFNPVSFITTNFDDLLETAAIQYCQSFISVACDSEVAKINGDKYILKLHGDLKHKNIVFKEEDYLNYSENFKLIETLLKSIFSTNTVVFIGYGLNDYNIKLVLNWAKSLLKDHFNKPIFIYTDSSPLCEAELLYHKSRGLCVIDCTQISKVSEEYLPRYMAVLEAIKKSTDLSLDGKTELEAFEILYRILEPLDKLQALRKGKKKKKLRDYIIIEENGQILANMDKRSHMLIQYFYKISSMPPAEYEALDEDIQIKYQTILSVLKKAQIYYIDLGNKTISFTQKGRFADPNCCHFDYSEMRKISDKVNEGTNKERYRKAFYLSRLKKYDDSYFLFAQIAREAFKSGDYLLYYLCEINCINLRKIIESSNRFYKYYCIEDVDREAPTIEKIEKIFEGLPIEFQNQYSNLKDLYSVNLLYKYSYMAFVDGMKMQRAIESDTVELGMTSSHKVIYRINEYMHFLLGNGIIVDVFVEYRNTVKYLMSLLVYKYSEQQKKSIHQQVFPRELQGNVYFDDFDFYCFIEYFIDKEIESLFSKNQLDSIFFVEEKTIEKVIYNILYNYEYLVSQNVPSIEISSFERQIKTLLMLLRYMDISQEIVDYICSFIFKYEFKDIFIDDKILFLDRQIAKRNMRSEVTSRLIEEKLVQYLDMHIKELESGHQFSLMSRNSTINYYNLANYIYPQNAKNTSHAISLRVSRIIEKELKDLIPSVVNYYWIYLSKYMKRKICQQIKQKLKNGFDFDLFKLLIIFHAKIDIELIRALKSYLHILVRDAENANNESYGIKKGQSYSLNPYEDLELVGYWCLLKILPKTDFLEFIGESDVFDFYILYDAFDFEKFNISWLLNLQRHALEVISRNKRVKEKIRKSIVNVLNDEKILKTDETKIMKILTTYFC